MAVFQFLVCIPLAVPAALAGDPAVSPLALPKNLWDGWMCYMGYNSVTVGEHPDNCWPDSPLYVTIYVLVNIGYNLLITLVRVWRGGGEGAYAFWVCCGYLDVDHLSLPRRSTEGLGEACGFHWLLVGLCDQQVRCCRSDVAVEFRSGISWGKLRKGVYCSCSSL